MFAKPFLGQLGNGHVQGVYSMCKVGFTLRQSGKFGTRADFSQDKHSLNSVASGSGDGVIKVWDLTSRDDEVWRTAAQWVFTLAQKNNQLLTLGSAQISSRA